MKSLDLEAIHVNRVNYTGGETNPNDAFAERFKKHPYFWRNSVKYSDLFMQLLEV